MDQVTFTYYKPSRYFGGTCYEAAGKAAAQAKELAKLLQRAILDTETLACNTFMQRQLDAGLPPQAELYSESPEGRVLTELHRSAGAMALRLAAIERAISFDPTQAAPNE